MMPIMRGLLSPRLQYLESKGYNSEYFAKYVNPRRGAVIFRMLAATGIVLVCYVLFTSMSLQSDFGLVATNHNQTTQNTSPSHPSKSVTQVQQEKVDSLKHTGNPLYYTIHTGQPYDIETAIRNVLNNVPDEVYTRDLLKPITGGGEERMSEVGLRVRLFKKYFDPWEALHVVTDGLFNTAFVRDDILHYLRDTDDITAITHEPRAEAIRRYETYRNFLNGMSGLLFNFTAPYFSNHMTLHGHMYNAGRGIVMSGNDELAPYMITAIASFRELGCDLPVEVMYLGDNDLNQDMREKLEEIPNVVTRDLRQMINDQGWELAGWAGKAFAAFMSSFREVILVDADVLFFRDPTVLFEEQGYVDTGALFFRDRVIGTTDRKNLLRKILPRPVSAKARESSWWTGESSEFQESGVVVVDKWRHFMSVFLVARMNGPDRSDTDAGLGTYSFWWGDKETWWVGFELAGDTDYHFHQGDTGNMGTISIVERDRDSGNISRPEPPVGEKIKLNVLSGITSEEGSEDGELNQIGGESPAVQEEQQTPGRRLSRRQDFFNLRETLPGNQFTTSELLALTNASLTLCSPQLLHLDLDYRPLWFNGWIQEDKFDHDPNVPVSKLEVFMSEKTSQGEKGDWRLGAHNMCCLKTDRLWEFNEEEKKAIEMIVRIGRGNGALAPVKGEKKTSEEVQEKGQQSQ